MKGQPTQHQFHGSQVRLTYFRWRATATSAAPGERPTVLLVHATGFHARCWDQVVAALPDAGEVIAVDMRGHGRSERRAPYRWDDLSGDLEELVIDLGLEAAVGVGHSMGGHSVTRVAARRPGAFSRLLLLDPVILDPAATLGASERGYAVAEDHPVARRRDHWGSWQEMRDRFAQREPFSLWQPEVLEDYCRFGLLPRTDSDGFELACPPVVEASVYLGNSTTDLHGLLGRVRIPVVVLRARARQAGGDARLDFSGSPTWPGLAAALADGRDVHLAHLTHFIPMQDPALVARFIEDPQAQP